MATDRILSLTNLPQIPEHKMGWPWVATIPEGLVSEDRMQPWPKISIVTPTYNQGLLLEETIRSVLLQGYPSLEYIVINNCSTDNSLDVIRKYEKWITYWETGAQREQSYAINKGFQIATGDILAWLNCGDLYAPDALRIVARRLADVSKGLLVGASVITRGTETLDGEMLTSWPSRNKMIYEAKTFPQASVFWTRDLWEAAQGLSDELGLAMDYHLWLQMLPQVNIFIPEAILLSYTRTSPGQKGVEGEQIQRQRACAAVKAARERGEQLHVWLAKLWLYHLRAAIWKKRWHKLGGSSFQHMASQLVLFPHRYKEMQC